MNKCKFEDCDKPHKAQGYCNKHYRRFKSHGDPSKVLIYFNMPPGESSFNALLSVYRNNAKKRDINFLLSKEEFRVLTKSRCYYCKILPIAKFHQSNRKATYIYNGVDRLDSHLDYTTNNVVSCCKKCNMMKGTMSVEEFLIHIQMIHENDLRENILINHTLGLYNETR